MKQLSKSDIKDINTQISNFGELDIKGRFVFSDSLVILDKTPILFQIDGKYYPTLKSDFIQKLPSVYIDMGAVKFIVSGADLMRPGITSFDKFDKDTYVVIRDSNYKKGLALGFSNYSSEELKSIEKGKVIRNIHYVGDKVWNYGREPN